MVKRKNPKIVFGFVGLPCAGKGTVIDYLVKKHGFFYSSTSDEIREEIRNRGQEITRDSLQRIGGELREKYGPGVLAERAYQRVVDSGKDKAVVDSIRAVGEIEFLKKQPSFSLFKVIANQKIRFQRMKDRARDSDDPLTWGKFQKMEERDKSSEGRNIEVCLQMADFTIKNSGTVDELHQQVEQVLPLDD